MTTTRRTFLAGAAALALTGCETGSLSTGDDWAAARADTETSIVFGRFRFIENGTELAIRKATTWKVSAISPRLRRLEDGRQFMGNVEDGGHFRWSLPPGTYLIDRLNYVDPWAGAYYFVPKVAFRVYEPGRVYYVGTLRADAVSKKLSLGGKSMVARFSIEDRYAAERAYLQQTAGIDPKDVTKVLMIHDERLPETWDTTEGGRTALTILDILL